MDVRVLGFDNPLLSTIHHLLNVPDLENDTTTNSKSSPCAPTRTYVRDTHAMAATPADVKELPSSYSFVVDMPGVRSGEIKVQVEDGNMLVISGERKREEENEDEKDKASKYLRMERRMGKFLRKFALPENADLDGISAVCKDGVLTVTVQKKPPPGPKKPKTVEVTVA